MTVGAVMHGLGMDDGRPKLRAAFHRWLEWELSFHQYIGIDESEFRVINRVVALIFILVLSLSAIGGIAAYVTNPPLDYVFRADQSPIGNEPSARVVKADRLVPKRDALLSSGSKGLASSETKASVIVLIPLPPNRQRQAGATSGGLLNDAQLKGIKNRLRLTPEQAQQWPAVEEALRDVAQRHLRHGPHRNKAPGKIETTSPEIQRLIAVSEPLIKQLREDQKREVRELVRMIGLGTVASNI